MNKRQRKKNHRKWEIKRFGKIKWRTVNLGTKLIPWPKPKWAEDVTYDANRPLEPIPSHQWARSLPGSSYDINKPINPSIAYVGKATPHDFGETKS